MRAATQGRSELSTYKNCYILFLCLCRFWTYVLELSVLPSSLKSSSIQPEQTTEDDTLLQDLARRKICNIDVSLLPNTQHIINCQSKNVHYFVCQKAVNRHCDSFRQEIKLFGPMSDSYRN